MSKKKNPRVFDETFKINTVKAWRASGKTAPQFAREYDIEPNYLYAWARKYETGGQVPAPEIHQELKRLRKEKEELKQEIEILRKAQDYFSGQE